MGEEVASDEEQELECGEGGGVGCRASGTGGCGGEGGYCFASQTLNDLTDVQSWPDVTQAT